MRRRLLVLALLGACAGCGGGSSVDHSQPLLRGSAISPPIEAAGFTLADQTGRHVSLAGQRGHYVVVTFLYTHCPDVCPVIAGNLNVVLRSAVARRTGLRVLAVSVDPKRDTPAAVRRYVRERGLVPAFHYLVGSRAQLERVWKAFHIAALGGPAGTVTHSAIELLIDPTGRERLSYGSDIESAWLIHDLKALEADA